MPDYSTITELPDSLVMPIQIRRTYSRYLFGSLYCEGRDVLEVACGGGQGLGLLAKKARKVVGGDYEEKNLAYARQTYKGQGKIEIVSLDAHDLKLPDRSFDVILLYEAIYYLHSPEKFLQECRRVLRPGGVLILCTANKDWPDFNPSPFSHRYFSVPELNRFLGENGFRPKFYGAFPDDPAEGSRLRSLIKKVAVKLHLIPKTMKGKVLLKRLFFGGLVKLPWELKEGDATYEEPVALPADQVDTVHTALYAVGTSV
ncbi:MAG: class I SAM-dependent methyltransferase [Deltaproteobacteria bacterium]|nr:class I SAM-dependent methyltransferase [Deltaproteobacteria bacterium]